MCGRRGRNANAPFGLRRGRTGRHFSVFLGHPIGIADWPRRGLLVRLPLPHFRPEDCEERRGDGQAKGGDVPPPFPVVREWVASQSEEVTEPHPDLRGSGPFGVAGRWVGGLREKAAGQQEGPALSLSSSKRNLVWLAITVAFQFRDRRGDERSAASPAPELGRSWFRSGTQGPCGLTPTADSPAERGATRLCPVTT